MKLKKIKVIEYVYGDEKKIIRILNKSKEPLLIKIKNFTDEFNLDYFANRVNARAAYDVFENGYFKAHQVDKFATVIKGIKKNKPYRIFGQFLSKKQSAKIEAHIPLWQVLPFRPRFFNERIKVAYFFGGKDAHTAMHYDREHCCNLHICLSGKKEVLLFTADQNDKLYKEPFVGDSLVDFSQPLDTLKTQFPKLEEAEGYRVILRRGDLLFMPRNCWHYTQYIDASAAATYIFYPRKIMQIYGCLTGYFFLGYKGAAGFGIYNWQIVKKFIPNYALSTGKKRVLFKLIERIAYLFILPLVGLLFFLTYQNRVRRWRKRRRREQQ